MKKLLTLPLIAALAFQFTTVASADTIFPTPTPMPSVIPSPVPTFEPGWTPDPEPTSDTAKADQTQKWVLIGSAAVLGLLLLFDHAPAGCSNNDNTIDDDFSTDGAPRRPAVGLTLHFPIP